MRLRILSTPHSPNGFLTVDFMMAMIVTLGCMLLLLRVSVSLVSVQMGQYLVYAAARAHSAADLTPEAQAEAGNNKYKSLLKQKGLIAGFLVPGVNLQRDQVIGDFSQIYEANPDQDGTREGGTPFVGARAEIKLPRLGAVVPFLGRTADRDQEFKSFVSAMQFREPSQAECRAFFEQPRYQRILNLDPNRFGRAAGFATDYVPQEDSGC